MEGKLPEIYWYVFWIGLVLISFGMAYLGGRAEHKTRMKALDILKMYAEKGGEPPQSMMEQLGRQAMPNSQQHSEKQSNRSALIQAFIGFLFMACASGGLHYWIADAGEPRWAVFATQASMAFFGFGSFGFLVTALLTRDK